MLNGGDLFSGIGGAALALGEWVRPRFYCEIDSYCRGVLLSRMAEGRIPVAPIFHDIREVSRDTLPWRIDILTGGFPCQDLSVAGLGAGLAGERSGLFFEIARLVGEIQPRFVFLENVPAIRSRGADIVVGRLAALGYDCRWGVLSAFDVGAPHLRERWWLLAHGHGHGREGKPERDRAESAVAWPLRQDAHGFRDVVPDAIGQQLRHESGGGHGSGRSEEAELGDDGAAWSLADADGERSQIGRNVCTWQSEPSGNSWWAVEPDMGRMAHGVPKRVDRLRALGNAWVPAVAREAFTRLAGLKGEGR